ncbi:MAG: hypothetical protein EBX52_14865, partial [Proteobacteria bacterium]|nr:hypothetical protein [Pseudomonadota bacterium]
MVLLVLLVHLGGAGMSRVEAQELACKPKEGALSSLPKVCDEGPFFLDDPSYCKSCAVKSQTFAKVPVVNELETFLKNPMVSVGKPSEDPDVKTVPPTCVGEKGETIPYQVYVRRREGCRRQKDRLQPAEIKKRADALAKKDQEKFSTVSKDDLLANWNARIDRYKVDKQCTNGVRITLQEVHQRSTGEVYENGFSQIIDLNQKRPGIDERSLPTLERAYAKEDSPERKAFEETYEKAFRRTGQVCHGTGVMGYTQTASVSDIEVAVPATGYFKNSQGELAPDQAAKIRADIQKR